MIYAVIALKSEAQAFVDKYKLQKSVLGEFVIFKNSQMIIIISGMGVYNSMMATQTLIDTFDINDEDIYANIGICGANRSYEIGELIDISTILYQEKRYILNDKNLQTITCLDKPSTDESYEIVDMESFGFYDALIHSPAIKNRYILKVVSDHFEPHKVSKDGAKSLLFNQIDAISTLLHNKGEF